jgi:Xaa-Pro dipeptidase
MLIFIKMNYSKIELQLLDAQNKAWQLLAEAENRNYIVPGIFESALNTKVYDLAFEMFGIKKFWHKRIVRAGANTLLPYKENPPDLILQANDIMFFDFGPVFEDWEADIGKTYVLGNDALKIKLMQDVERAWHRAKAYYLSNTTTLTAGDLYKYVKQLALDNGWAFGQYHCGHLIGNFPHERIHGDDLPNYLHAGNTHLINDPDQFGDIRHWILEIHFIDEANKIGGFFEQILTIDY